MIHGPRDAEGDLLHLARRVSVAVVAVTVLVAATRPSVMTAAGPALLVVGFLVGLPHGAVDHLVPFWVSRSSPSPLGRLRTLGLVLGGYVLVAAAAWVGLRGAGALVLPLLLAVSVAHFGLGDVMARPPGARRPRRASGRWATTAVLVAAEVIARGGPAVVGPIALWGPEADVVIRTIAPRALMPGAVVRGLLSVAVLLCTMLTAGDAVRRRRWDLALEVVLLAALFACAPPAAAFGVYFGGWHGLRHTVRMIVTDPANSSDLRRGRPVAAVRRFVRSAALPTVAALAAVVVLVATTYRHTGLTGLVLAALLALTVPHVVVVGLLDLRVPVARWGRGADVRGSAGPSADRGQPTHPSTDRSA